MAGTVSREALLKILGENKDALAKLEEVTVKADELKASNPELTVQIDKAKAVAEARLLKSELKAQFDIDPVKAKIEPDVSGFRLALSKGLSFLGGTGGSGLSGSLGGTPLVGGLLGSTGIYGLAGVAVAIAALLPEIAGLVSGLAAAGAGVGAFGLLAIPAINTVKTAYTNLGTAQTAYQKALETEKDFPTKAHAQAVVTALNNLRDVQNGMSPSTQQAVSGIQQLVKGFDGIAKAIQPTVMKVFTDALKIANTLLPTIKPFAQAAGTAIDGLLGKAETFFKSADFKKWLSQFQSIVAPAITAIGDGIGKLAPAIGKLLTVMSGKDVANAIKIAFQVMTYAVETLTGAIKIDMAIWDALKTAAVNAVKFLVSNFLAGVGVIIDGAARAFGWIPGIGGKLKTAASAFDAFRDHVNAVLAGIHDKTVTVTVQMKTLGPLSATYQSQVPAFASGGLVTAASGGDRSGMILAGEKGPELIRVPPGSFVYNNQQTRSMLAAGGGDVQVRLYVDPSFSRLGLTPDQMAAIRYEVRTKGGGNVQAAFGRG